MSAAPFVIRERVRWRDCDPMGIIRYDAYTRFFELGEEEMLRALGIDHVALADRFGLTLPRRVMHLEYPSAPRLDELLALHVYVGEVGVTSLHLHVDAYGAGGALRMAGHLVLICAYDGPDRGTALRKQPWPPAFLAALAPHRLTVDEARAFAPGGEA